MEDRTFAEDAKVLRRFAVAPSALLGYGGESRVYALSGELVLRVYGAQVDRAYVQRLRAFYDGLATFELDFEVPNMHEVGAQANVLFAVEKRIAGRRLTEFLRTASGAGRRLAIERYLDVAAQIASIPIDADQFGELLASRPVRAHSWPEYLASRARRALGIVSEESRRDVPELRNVVKAWEASLTLLGDVEKPKLVHGDYFPGNVMAGDDGLVSAVIDFSPMTVAGDTRLDLLSAAIFLEVDEGYRTEDSVIARELLRARHANAVLDLEDVYRTYYALYFFHTKRTDPSLYRWCVANLNRAATT